MMYKIIYFLLWCLVLLFTVKSIIFGMNTLPFSPDSWAYWELSKTVFSNDFYHIHGWRQFQTTVPYSMSFPPFWPIVIGSLSYIMNIGPAIMPLLAGTVFISSIIIIEVTLVKFLKIYFIGILSGFILLLDSGFVSELTAGRSIPMAFLLISSMVYFWLNATNIKYIITISLLSGLLVLTRFDMLPFVILLGVALYIKMDLQETSKKTKFIFLFYFIFLLLISPYIYYSMMHFDSFFATDNSLVSKSAYKIFVTHFPSEPVVTFSQQPLIWLDRILENIKNLFHVKRVILLLALFLCSIILVIFLFRLKKLTIELKLFFVFILFYLSSLSAYVLTGYYDGRYFSVITLYILLFNLIGLGAFFIKREIYVTLVIGMATIFFIGLQIHRNNYINFYNFKIQAMSEKEKMAEGKLSNFSLCTQHLSKGDKIMFLSPKTSLLVSSVLNIDTTLTPSNFNSLTTSEKQNFLALYQIKAYYGDQIKNLEGISNLSFKICKFDNKFVYLKENN